MGRYASVDLKNLGFLNEASKAERQKKFEISDIHIDDIVPNAMNQYSVDSIEELKFSILHNGLKQNLEVYKIPGGKYRLLTGERRYTALKELVKAGHSEFELVPCLITNLSDNELPLSEKSKELYALVTTNSEARELTDGDRMFQVNSLKAIYKELKENGVKLTGNMNDLIAEQLNISPRQVKRFNYVEEHGTEEIKEKLANNEISLNTAENVAHLSPAQQTKIIAGEAAAVTPAKVEKLKAQAAKKNENRTKSKASPSDADIKGYYIPSLKSKSEYIAQKAAEISLPESEYKKLIKALEAAENILDKIIKIIEK